MEGQNNRLLELVQLRQKNLQKIKSKLGQAEDLLKCGSSIDYVYEELLNAVSLTEIQLKYSGFGILRVGTLRL